MRVLAVIDSLGQGGAEYSLLQSLAAMEGVEASVAIHRRESVGFEDVASDLGLPIHHVHGGLLGRSRRFRALVRTLAPDVVHSTLFMASTTARLALVGTNVPLVCSLVGEPYSKERVATFGLKRRMAAVAVRWIDKISARRVDQFHAVTMSVAEHHHRTLSLDLDRITVSWRGRNTSEFTPPTSAQRSDARTRLGASGDYIVSIGRLEPEKGHDVLLNALPLVLRERPKAHCVIVGREGNESGRLRRQIEELQLEEQVTLAGFRGDVVNFLHAADCFVLAATSGEGIAGVVIEAMLCGVPVVAASLPGIREITEDGRYATLVPPGDASALGAAIVDALSSPERRGGEEAERAAERFGLEQAAARLAGVYEVAIARRSSVAGRPRSATNA